VLNATGGSTVLVNGGAAAGGSGKAGGNGKFIAQIYK
jgi:hypothetical protein